ncbi:kinase-like domain-containing protein [Xylaria nigripes]|nr:kinase-like domain-containing protein [Xylaria nigripes]
MSLASIIITRTTTIGTQARNTDAINTGPFIRLLTIFTIKARSQRFIRKFLKPSPGYLPFSILAEAHTMQPVARYTSVPVPKVHCAFIHMGNTYIVMSQSKARILEQLRQMAAEFRSVPPPKDASIDSLLWGLFPTKLQLHEALANDTNIDVSYDSENLPDDMADLFTFHQQSNHELILTHSNLSNLNILVQGDEVVGVADWETEG